MMRWVVLAVLAVALTATATVVVQSWSGETSMSDGVIYPANTNKAAGPQPRAVVEGGLTYKFGAKAQHTTFEKDFVIKNEGEGPLTLQLEAPACSCTVAGFQDKDGRPTGSKVVPPKGQATIHLTWETRTFSGKYRKPATLLTNDPENPQLEFAAEGEVFPAVIVYPDTTMNFNEISTDEDEHVQVVAVYSPDRPELKITEITSSRPDVITATDEAMSPQNCKALKIEKGREIKVKIKRGLPLGAFYEELAIKTDHPLQSDVKINVTGKLVGPISLTPERARLFGVSGSNGGRGEVRILVRNQRPTRFEVAHAPDRFKVEITPDDKTGKPGRYLLTITIPPGMPTGLFDDTIVLKTDHPNAAELKVPVGGYVSDEK